MFDEIRATWSEMLSTGGAQQRLVDGHPLHLYYGADASSKPLFFLITAEEPHVPEMSDSVLVERGQRRDGHWTIVLTLQDRDLTDSFMGLCIELARRSEPSDVEATALNLFFEALHDLRRMLRSKSSRLSIDAIRGLIAEMHFTLSHAAAALGITDALIAWRGPYGAAQDFVFPGGNLVEMKAVHSDSSTVEISSVDQLDPLSGGDLILATVAVEPITSGGDDGFSLPILRDLLHAAVAFDTQLQDKLSERLEAVGYDYLDDYYEAHRFTVSEPTYFGISDDFPRIRRASVPFEVDRLQYRLRLSGLSAFRIEPPEWLIGNRGSQ